MTTPTFILTALASWTVLAVAGTTSMSRVARQLKRLRRRPTRDLRDHRAYPPAVPEPTTPPLSQTVPAADWFRGIPIDCLSDDAVRPLFDELIEMEGLA